MKMIEILQKINNLQEATFSRVTNIEDNELVFTRNKNFRLEITEDHMWIIKDDNVMRLEFDEIKAIYELMEFLREE